LREVLAILMMSPMIAVEKRRAFLELHGLVSDELVSGGIGSWRSLDFPRRFMATLACLDVNSADNAYLTRRVVSLRAPLMKVLDRARRIA
jgi:hypothetical protein